MLIVVGSCQTSVVSCAVCHFSENVPRARKELSNLISSRYTSARRKLCCLRRVFSCLVAHSSCQDGTGLCSPTHLVGHDTKLINVVVVCNLRGSVLQQFEEDPIANS